MPATRQPNQSKETNEGSWMSSEHPQDQTANKVTSDLVRMTYKKHSYSGD